SESRNREIRRSGWLPAMRRAGKAALPARKDGPATGISNEGASAVRRLTFRAFETRLFSPVVASEGRHDRQGRNGVRQSAHARRRAALLGACSAPARAGLAD